MVAVAQLVEPRVVIPVVEGSSPFSHPNGFAGPHREHFQLPVDCWGCLDFTPYPNGPREESLTPSASFETAKTAPFIKQ
jgi:hypothetical protein